MIRVIGWAEGRQAQGVPLGGIAAAGLEPWLRRERFMFDIEFRVPVSALVIAGQVRREDE